MQPGASDPRNATMLKMFSMIDAGERAGSGISKILHGWKEAGYASPFYEEEYGPDRTILTLPLIESPSKVSNGVSNGLREILPPDIFSSLSGERAKHSEAIIEYLTENGPSKTAGIAQSIGLGISWTSELLRNLTSKGIVVVRGKARATKYQLAPHARHAPSNE